MPWIKIKHRYVNLAYVLRVAEGTTNKQGVWEHYFDLTMADGQTLVVEGKDAEKLKSVLEDFCADSTESQLAWTPQFQSDMCECGHPLGSHGGHCRAFNCECEVFTPREASRA